MLQRGDLYHMAICNKTGMIAVYNPNKNIFYSPMADGPIKYTGSLVDGTTQVHQLTRFGRDFSIVAVPYSFKLLMQELLAMNIRMSIITDDNISQIENMGFSDSIERLMFLPNAVPKNVIDNTKELLESSVIKNIPSPKTPPPRQKYIPQSPAYTPPEDEPILTEEYPSPEGLPPGFQERPPSPEEIPPSPEEIPPSPEEIPPSPEELPPGLQEESSPMQVGGKVHYRGDNNPGRLWTIQHLGYSYYTIDTEDTNGISTEDSIRIVKPEDIYSPNDSYQYSIPTEYDSKFSSFIPPSLPNTQDPKLNFAPVIKIFNHGNDMSQDTASTPENISYSNDNAMEYVNTNTNTNANTPSIKDDIVDFSKPMIIKKM
jgi:hypothetical protein